ncbi:quinone oxidoreductase [Glaciimonas sp. Gout2]|uniref:quinone oxidoreductase family protein n=1 Tax=unclassified Glaciimonas TaxID=2644401 RepID=UPI002B23B4D3|nr:MULTISPECIES: quinone oxidoreductase [unclassified Glaciimonas]MEB0012399.1 quinone oxidoreductase [Glaciimonas sp. Cout2]MEB0080409.1 quinone oxidoreductase [Glaciimonas sp. Gout2]
MVKAIVIRKTGGPEVMEYVDVEVGEPGPGEVRIRNVACGVNFIDVYFRIGLYPQPLPGGVGQEGAGVIEAVGLGVLGFKPGDRVAYAGRPNGSYSEVRLMPVAMLVKLPDEISFDVAAASLLQGLTVQYLFRRTFPVKEGDTILFHAAAGGVGLIAAQWARSLGVKMIGTVGSDEKKALALAAGCTHVINSKTENIVERMKEFTNGKGVPVVFDSIGKDTFIDSLDCLSPLGTMVSFGSSSGPVPPFSLNELVSRGSLSITRPSLSHYISTRAELDAAAADLFQMIGSKKIVIDINQRYALKDAAQAHIDLEGRKTTGSTILIP